jgi:hypothetical protein
MAHFEMGNIAYLLIELFAGELWTKKLCENAKYFNLRTSTRLA